MSDIPQSFPAPKSAWTLETLRVVLEAEIKSLDQVTASRFMAGDTRAGEAQEAIKVGLANAQRALDAAAVLAKDAVSEAKAAHAAEHAALAMALSLAMLELKERLAEMNNFRAQIAAERSDFVTRDRLQATVTTLEGALASSVTLATTAHNLTDARVTAIERAVAGMQSRFTAYATAFAVGVVVFELFIKYVVQ